MAIDTAIKRRQMLGLGIGGPPSPDGTIDADDRATLIGVYSFASSDTLMVVECAIATTRTMECAISITS